MRIKKRKEFFETLTIFGVIGIIAIIVLFFYYSYYLNEESDELNSSLENLESVKPQDFDMIANWQNESRNESMNKSISDEQNNENNSDNLINDKKQNVTPKTLVQLCREDANFRGFSEISCYPEITEEVCNTAPDLTCKILGKIAGDHFFNSALDCCEWNCQNVPAEQPPAPVEYYCQWSWPQKIINKNTKEVLWNCNLERPYCKAGTTTCCKYDANTKTHYDCMEMNVVVNCVDSDENADNPFLIKGTCIDAEGNFEDSCNGEAIREFHCGGGCGSELHWCGQDGMYCEDGKCNIPNPNTCSGQCAIGGFFAGGFCGQIIGKEIRGNPCSSDIKNGVYLGVLPADGICAGNIPFNKCCCISVQN